MDSITITQEELLKKIAEEKSYDTWSEAMNDSPDWIQVECTIEAMDRWTAILDRRKQKEDPEGS